MAQRSSSGRGGTATRTKRQAGNQTPNTPGVSESAISGMKVDEIRGQLRRRGVSGVSGLRKPELVKTLARTLRAEERGGAARGSSGPAGRAGGTRASAGRASATKKAATRKAAGGRAAASRAKAAPANKAAPAKKAAARKAAGPAKATRKAAPAKKTAARKATGTAKATRPAASARKTAATPARKAAAPSRSRSTGGGTTTAGGVRTGRGSSRSVRSSQVISSLADRPERPGRSLVTTNHDVIRRWAQERNARPATITGTEQDGRAGVLTFHVPGYRESSRVREITWDEWFRTFDLRKLNLIFQEQLRDGRQSTFFRTESPDREDG
ncbi:hypothetical protein [Micromonospora endolithica]|uniref:Rho termination factor N-terminal domain-containing protein n=1 Tax=Micromonospora endolithica TaxID=230091 RepID=A0A3A9YUD7_9ACTN|nr:hypothetical protein [Micromonospora endolithica]RKN39134.1 hypothetical protein D7223_29750 [Micromonospora endolithica]TWJ25643.1 hypothetical protein JD76_05816 [Micromonospora endolithica]